MMNDSDPIGREVHVEFERIDAKRNCLRERLDRILGSVRAIPPMTDYRSSIRFEQNVHVTKITGRRQYDGAAPLLIVIES